MSTRSGEALRRLGGPVCPVCDTVGAPDVEVRYLGSDGSTWLKEQGRGVVERQSLAPMCKACFLTMENAVVKKRAEAARQRVAQDCQAVKTIEDRHRLSLMNGPAYRAACADHEDDLAAAEEMASEWGVGNGLFGSRPTE